MFQWLEKLHDINIIIIETNTIGRIKTVVLAITLKPNRLRIMAIAINIRITISKSILGKDISTRLSAKVLTTKAESTKR